MFTVFQGETGGTIDFLYNEDLVSAVSGYALLVGRQRQVSYHEGTVLSGVLSIAKSGIQNLDPEQYIILPQIVDTAGLVWFLTPDDVKVVDVPDL